VCGQWHGCYIKRRPKWINEYDPHRSYTDQLRKQLGKRTSSGKWEFAKQKRQWHFEDRTYKVSFIWNQGLGRCSLPWCQLVTCEPNLCRRPGVDVQRPSMYRYEYMNAPSFRFSIYWVSSLTAAMQVGIHMLWSARCFLNNYDRGSRLSSCLYPIPHALAENAARLWGGSALTEVTPNDILKGCLH
jgi:hypothetical protein